MLKTNKPFIFYSQFALIELTGLKAVTLEELLTLIKTVPDASIYHHTHRFLQHHHYPITGSTNDFSYWVTLVLGEAKLGELLTSLDIISYTSIQDIRQVLIDTISNYIDTNPNCLKKFAYPSNAFYFLKSKSFIFPTNYIANNLTEFREGLEKITLDSLYFHFFEARLRLKKADNDFSLWLGTTLQEKELAKKINLLDPYTFSLETLKKTIINIIKTKEIN